MQQEKNLDTNVILDRRAGILEYIERDGQVKVVDLSKRYKVSEVTIRNDLAQLEEKKLLIRARGGAIKAQPVGIDFNLNEKSHKHSKEKQAIGKKAASLIRSGETIILDSGTTTLEIAKNMDSFSNLTVITNALNIAFQLVNKPGIKVIMLGGFLRENSYSLVGPIAENSIKNYYCDKVFLGVDGIDANYGISTPNVEEAHLNRIMIEVAKEIIVVTDSSKYSRKSFAFISKIDAVDIVISDQNTTHSDRKALANKNIETIIA